MISGDTSHTFHLYTDAAGSIGFGAVFGCHWLHGRWPKMWKTFNIAFLELFPIVLAVHVWGALIRVVRTWRKLRFLSISITQAVAHLIS